MDRINQRVTTFLGLNNLLDPLSAEYQEGMAYVCDDSRLNENGLWAGRPTLVACASPPTVDAAPSGGTGHWKFLTVDDVPSVVEMGVNVSCDVGANKKLYSTNGTGAIKNDASGGSDVVVVPSPTLSSVTSTSGSGRQEKGKYCYMVTQYDPVYKAESLPSTVKAAANDIDQASYNYTVLAASGLLSGNKYRWYRTLRTNADDEVYNPVNKFYFLGETSAGSFDDRFADAEISDYEYEGRGSAPPDDIDYLVSFANRMLYFKGNVLYWSSSGRPQEVAQEYTLTFDSSVFGSSVTQKVLPLLSVGVYGEAYTEIVELAGQKVLAAMPYKGKLYVWTASMAGYLEATNRLEGYKFHTLRNGVGVTSDKVLALSPYGIFGADRQGIWLLRGHDNFIRLSDNRVDLHDTNKSTGFTETDFGNAFGAWCPAINEYWFGVSGKVIAYQADRGIFVGPYTHEIDGGVAFTSAGGAQTYFTGEVTPSRTDADTTARELQFWLGQSQPTIIKDNVTVEMFLPTNGGVTAEVIQNEIASATGASGTSSKTFSTAVERVSPSSSGRLFRLKITGSSAHTLALINYKYNAVGWSKTYGR